ncbi:MAG: PIN domain-containing protein [Magnetococcus sp. YQC-5]
MIKRTYVDSNILIAAFQSDLDTATRALAILDDASRYFIGSAFIRLETLPKPRFYGFLHEVAFMQHFLDRCQEYVSIDDFLIQQAEELAARYDLSPVDALHVSAALRGTADEFVTLEKPGKPLCQIKEIKVVSLYALKVKT